MGVTAHFHSPGDHKCAQASSAARNHTCAKIRAGVAVMARKTCTTTKSIEKLQDKLDIFIAVHNRNEFC